MPISVPAGWALWHLLDLCVHDQVQVQVCLCVCICMSAVRVGCGRGLGVCVSYLCAWLGDPLDCWSVYPRPRGTSGHQVCPMYVPVLL